VGEGQNENTLTPSQHARQAVICTLALYLGYALVRALVPAREDIWSFALVLGFYAAPAWLLRRQPELAQASGIGADPHIPPLDTRGVKWALAFIVVSLPLFALGFWAFYTFTCSDGTALLRPILWLEGFTPLAGKLEKLVGVMCRQHNGAFWPSAWQWPQLWTRWWGLGFAEQVAIGLFAVALPEELFHRGYLMGALERRWPARWKLFGVPFGWAAIFSSGLFAAGHLVSLHQTSRLATFFPALIFAWLWRRSGSIWAPTLYHLGCNLFMDLLLALTFQGSK
jgi:membrane protease YdiL (CAAX protease family)